MPELSVIMGVLCHEGKLPMLKRSVGSLLSQTYKDLEIIICDDGSDKAVTDYLDSEAERGAVKLVRRGDLKSLQTKLNACLKECGGSFVARMDDDDFSHPDRFAVQTEYLSENSDIAFCGSYVNLIRAGKHVGKKYFPERPAVKDFFMTQPYIHPTLVFRKEALDAVGGYTEDSSVDLCEDYDLLLRLYEAGYRGGNVQKELLDYTLPEKPGKRKMRHRFNEVKVRFRRFRALGMLPKALPYVIKPVIVGLIPAALLERIKERGIHSETSDG